MAKCIDCGNEIPAARLQAVPDTDYCVRCVDSHTEPVMCRIIYSHKCDSDLFIARGRENIRRLNNEYNRSR